MPSVIAMMERREARAREVLDGAEARLREAEEQAAEARQRWESARIGREELMDGLAATGAQAATWAGAVVEVPQEPGSAAQVPSSRAHEG